MPKKDTKKNEKVDVEIDEEERGVNKETKRANLSFNVNKTHKWVKDFFGKCDKLPKRVKGTDDEVLETVKHPNAKFIITVIDQIICLDFVDEALKTAPKGKAELYLVNDENLQNIVKMNDDYKYTFSSMISGYDCKQTYAKLINLNENDVKKYIASHALGGGLSTVNVDNSGLNFLAYVLANIRSRVCSMGYTISKYAKKTTVSPKTLICASNAFFKGELLKKILTKMEEVDKLVRDSVKTKSDDKKKDEKKDEKKKSTKKPVKEEVVESEKEESEAEVEESEIEESESEKEESEVEEEKPKKGKGKNK